jgi:hypothetical protein
MTWGTRQTLDWFGSEAGRWGRTENSKGKAVAKLNPKSKI